MKATTSSRHSTSNKRVGKYARESATPNWKRHLPTGWQAVIDPPLHFEHYREYEIYAERSVGYDADDKPCFTAHHFRLTRLATDDDEEFYEVVTRFEEMAAWRLRDERWLVYRASTAIDCDPARGFYALSPDMPR